MLEEAFGDFRDVKIVEEEREINEGRSHARHVGRDQPDRIPEIAAAFAGPRQPAFPPRRTTKEATMPATNANAETVVVTETAPENSRSR